MYTEYFNSTPGFLCISNVTCTADHVKDKVVDDAGCSVIEVLRSTHGFLDMIVIIG